MFQEHQHDFCFDPGRKHFYSPDLASKRNRVRGNGKGWFSLERILRGVMLVFMAHYGSLNVIRVD